MIEAKVIRPELEKLKSEIKLPDIYNEAGREAESQEEFEIQQQARSIYEKTLDSDFQSFNGFNVSVKDEDVEIPISFNVGEDERLAMKNDLMDFDCDQRDSVHFFYTLPYTKNKALIETTWLSKIKNDSLKDYDEQLKNYIRNHLNIRDYKVNYSEVGAIPLFHPTVSNERNKMNIGTAGGMTRLSTGYTFLNIQEHSKYIRKNIHTIKESKRYEINKKYKFLDKIFLKVLNYHPEKMANIFFDMFNNSPETIIKFLSNKSSLLQDLFIILKMPKWLFIKIFFKNDK